MANKASYFTFLSKKVLSDSVSYAVKNMALVNKPFRDDLCSFAIMLSLALMKSFFTRRIFVDPLND